MPTTSNTACYQPPTQGCCDSGLSYASAVPVTAPSSLSPSVLMPGLLPSGVTIAVSQVTGPGKIASGITLDATQITGTIPASALPPNVLTATLGPVTGVGPASARDLILTLNGVQAKLALTPMTSGVGGRTLIGFAFPAN